MKYLFGITYQNEEEKKIEALSTFADTRNVWPLLRIVMATSDMDELSRDNNFWLKLLYTEGIVGENKQELLKAIKEKITIYNFGDLTEVPSGVKKQVEKYWNITISEELEQLPFFMLVKPMLTSDEFSFLIEDKIISNQLMHKDMQILKKHNVFKNIVLKMLETDDIKGFEQVTRNFISYGAIDYYDDYSYENNGKNKDVVEKINFKNYFQNKVLENVEWFPYFHSLLFESGYDVLKEYIKENKSKINLLNLENSKASINIEQDVEKEIKKVEKNIIKKIKEFLPFLKEQEVEHMISYTLVDTDNFRLTEKVLSLLDKNLKTYEPKFVPLWDEVYGFTNKDLIKILDKKGAKLLDFNPNKKQILLYKYCLLFTNDVIAKSFNYDDTDSFHEQMLITVIHNQVNCKVEVKNSTRENLKNFNAFSIVAGSENGTYFDNILNRNIANMDVGLLLNNKKNIIKYKDLEDIEKFIVVEQLLEKTWFAPIFYDEELHARSKKEKKWTLANYYSDTYNDKDGCYLIKEHLSLMDKLNKDFKNTKYKEHYVDFMLEVLTSVKTNYVKEDTELHYSLKNIMNKISECKDLDWKNIQSRLNIVESKNNYVTVSEYKVLNSIYLKMSYACLNNLLENKEENKSKKMKI